MRFLGKFLIRIYQLFVSPALRFIGGPLSGCRFEPSCSHYAREAIHVHGLVRGGLLAGWRILRCNPLSKPGYDPVPHVIAGLRRTNVSTESKKV